jgi:putative Mg2+ transporter-C (MgtC) family protein
MGLSAISAKERLGMHTASGIWEITPLALILRMLVAAVLGGAIGIEREWSNHAAGFRTHILVCLGSATIMLLSIYGFSDFVNETNVRVDPSRLAAQVVSGIGFLGAGAIIRNGNVVKGLTTAASIWVVAAIGLCTGAGFFTGAFVCTFLAVVSLYLLNKWEKLLMRNRRIQEVKFKIRDVPGALGKVASTFGMHGIEIANIKDRKSVV